MLRSRALSTLRFALFLAAFVACASAASPTLAADLPTTALSINGHKLTAEVAATTEHRTTGLMHRFSLKPDHGMLFVFPNSQPQAFWMKNTYIALSIAYVDEGGKIVNIEDMAPRTETTHPSNGPVVYALEMKKGWFKEHGIDTGAKVVGLDKVPKPTE